MTPSSVIFRPYRSLGLVSSDVPFVVKYKPHSKEYNVLVPVGERFNIYQLPNLRLLGISDCLPTNIIAFTSDRSYVYGASKNVIYAFRGLHHIHFKLEGHNSPIRKIIAFEDRYLASYDEAGLFILWNLQTRESFSRTVFSTNVFDISSMCHPTGYGDKLLLGSSQGPLQLWKTLAKKPIYWFRGFDSSVTCIVQAPSFDVCAIGLGNGQIVLHNLRYDTTLFSVAQDGGSITTIEFRSATVGLGVSEALRRAGIENFVEPNASIYLLAGSESGRLSIWELESGGTCRAVNQAEDFHLARVVHFFCIPSGEAAGALVSSGADNCVKVSFFDRPDSVPIAKHIRSGHFLPPCKIAFWTGGTAGGSLLVSGGPDSQLRIFSTYNERYDRSLGRAYSPFMPSAKRLTSVAQRLPYLLPGPSAIALSPGRANDWDSIAVAHTDRREVSTWNFVRATRGRHWLDPRRFHGKGGEALRVHRSTIATCLCMTRCGNFVVIGYSSGDVAKFNMQSGLEYGEFGNKGKVHESTVIGVHVTSVNRVLITVGRGEVKFWHFSTCKLIDTLDITSSPRFSKFHDESDTLALALSTGEVMLVNVVNRKIFRRFNNPVTHVCTDLTLSSDGTMMVTTHRCDPLIKTWDVVDCKLIDCFRVQRPATSVAFSPADDLLATTHTACLGVYLWDNRATYQRLHLKPLPEDYAPPNTAGFIELPTEGFSTRNIDSEEEDDVDAVMDVDEGKKEVDTCSSSYLSPDQLQDKMATLSGLPPSFFTAFLQLDAIKKRNAEAMKVTDDTGPAQLPFFLPAIETTTGMTWLDDEEEEKSVLEVSEKVMDVATDSRRNKLRRSKMTMEELVLDPGNSIVNPLLEAGSLKDPLNDDICDEVMSRLRRLTPSALDIEMRLLAPSRDALVEALAAIDYSNGGGIPLSFNPYARLSAFLSLLLNRFRRNLDFDLATACLEGLLRYHGELIARPPKAPTSIPTKPFSADQDDSGDAGSFCLGDMVAVETGCRNDHLDADRPLELMEAVLEAKRASHAALDMQISRSIALADFVRNATSTLQM